MNRCLRANQTQLQTQLQDEERRAREAIQRKDTAISELQEQLRDVMFYLETQQQINQMPAEARQEIQDGQINIAAAPGQPMPGQSSSGGCSASGGGGRPGGRKSRAKRGK